LFGIVIVAHAGLADEYLSALEHVVGKQPQTAAVAITADSDRAESQKAICGAVSDVDHGDGVVLVTDLFGGTPSNLASHRRSNHCGAQIHQLRRSGCI